MKYLKEGDETFEREMLDKKSEKLKECSTAQQLLRFEHKPKMENYSSMQSNEETRLKFLVWLEKLLILSKKPKDEEKSEGR